VFLAVRITRPWAVINRANVFAEQKIQSPIKATLTFLSNPGNLLR